MVLVVCLVLFFAMVLVWAFMPASAEVATD